MRKRSTIIILAVRLILALTCVGAPAKMVHASGAHSTDLTGPEGMDALGGCAACSACEEKAV